MRSYLGGRIAFGQRCCTMDCLLRNVSPAGALLVFEDTGSVPDHFDLEVPRKQETFPARLIWRRADRAGIAFLAPEPEAKVIPIDAMRRIRELEAERRTLLRRIAELTS